MKTELVVISTVYILLEHSQYKYIQFFNSDYDFVWLNHVETLIEVARIPAVDLITAAAVFLYLCLLCRMGTTNRLRSFGVLG